MQTADLPLFSDRAPARMPLRFFPSTFSERFLADTLPVHLRHPSTAAHGLSAALATGLLAPALYCAARKIPYSIAVIWSRSKAGDRWAKAVVAVYALFAAVTLLALVAELLRR